MPQRIQGKKTNQNSFTMKNFKTILAILVVATAMIQLASCKYDEILPPPPPDQVSFSGDIIPIFNQSCNMAGCHSGGAADFAPDLSAAHAYSALSDGGYIDTIMPENSLLYRWINGQEGVPMPPDGVNSFYNAIILKWMEQGAPDN
jgi:hypothetical protein